MVEFSVTESTCDFGLAGTTCTRTFASFVQPEYMTYQIVYCAAGIVAFALTSYKYIAAVRNLGSYLQRRAFLLSMYCSFTFIARGVDPDGFGHFLPHVVNSLLSDTCTASLYSIFIMSLTFWISILQRGAAPQESFSMLRVCEYLSHVAVWGFLVAVNLSSIGTKGFGGMDLAVVYLVTGIMLSIISSTFLVYGFRILRRLEHIASMNQAIHTHRMSLSSDYETHQSDHFVAEASPQACVLGDEPPRTVFKPSERIRRMLYLIETISVIAILAQFYGAFGARTNTRSVPLECANGFNCDELKMRVPCLHSLQFIAILVTVWTFRKIRKRETTEMVGVKDPVQII